MHGLHGSRRSFWWVIHVSQTRRSFSLVKLMGHSRESFSWVKLLDQTGSSSSWLMSNSPGSNSWDILVDGQIVGNLRLHKIILSNNKQNIYITFLWSIVINQWKKLCSVKQTRLSSVWNPSFEICNFYTYVN